MDNSLQAPFFKFLKRTVAGSLLCTGVLVAASMERKEGEVKTYVDQNLEQLIQEQEETLNIAYPPTPPPLQYSLPPEKKMYGASGLYDYENNVIYLRSSFLDPPEWDLNIAKETLHHELGHYYMDTLSERLVNHNYPYYPDAMPLTEMLGIKLVSEGTASYIERRMNGEQEDTFNDDDWPKNIQGFFFHPLLPFLRPEIIYGGGFHLVKPIIDQHGEWGIQYLIFNPPTEQELFTLPLYQQRILEELSRDE